MDTVLACSARGGAAGGLVRVGLVGMVGLLAVLVAACDSTAETTTTTVVNETTATTQTEPAPEPPAEEFVYRIGLDNDNIGLDNHWAYYGPAGTVANAWVFAPTKPALFRIVYPGLVIAPDVASGLPTAAVQEGDVWTVTQPIRDDYTWSDGTALTADDIVFTFETARDAQLIADWAADYPYPEGAAPRLLAVEALDEHTVRYTFDAKPGAAVWPHAVGVAPIMPRAPWEEVVASALQSEDPAAFLYEADPFAAGDLSGGPVHYIGGEPGVSVENIRNEQYANEGFTHQFWEDGSYALNGEMLYGDGVGDPVVEYTEGPFLERTEYINYEDRNAGMVALTNGDIDFWLDLVLSPSLRRQALEADNLAVTSNPSNGLTYLGFNLRKSPGKFVGFRQAMAYFDKETFASDALQGAVDPLYVMIPEGNQAWYNQQVAGEIASRHRGLRTNERIAAAYAALETDGFTWETPAVFDDDGNLVSPGEGIIDPEGNPVAGVEILTTPASQNPQFHAASLWLEDWAESLGIPAEAEHDDFLTIVESVWPGIGTEPTFDTVILLWTLGNPAWPTFHESFFHTRNLAEVTDGGNATGYSRPEFDALADLMRSETDQQAAFEAVWQMERMVADDLPYVVLFNSPIAEFYNKDLTFPFTQTLGGIQNLAGMQGTVSK